MTRPIRTNPPRPLAKLLLLSILCVQVYACAEPRQSLSIQFQGNWGDSRIDCDSPGVALSDLRFYISEIELITASGNQQLLVLDPSGSSPSPKVALIDLEHGEGTCANGSAANNSVLRGSTREGEITGIRFTIGVPFDLNHANPLLAESPLDDSAMHWHWRSGYKFLRAGVSTATDGFWIHLGSTACEGRVQNIELCQNPNRVTVELDGFTPGDTIVLDLAELFAGIDFDDEQLSDCSSSPAEPSCAKPFQALGLPFAVSAAAVQRVFRVRK